MPHPPTILVVDDEPAIRDLIADILETEAYHVLVASDGKAGLAAARKNRPALVLTDQMMPFLTGSELCALLKADAETATIPVGIMSAAPLPATVGSDFVLVKPFAVSELLETIAAMLSTQ